MLQSHTGDIGIGYMGVVKVEIVSDALLLRIQKNAKNFSEEAEILFMEKNIRINPSRKFLLSIKV